MYAKRGMTFIEVLIAIVMVGIIMSAMMTSLNFATKYARHNANKTMALNYAQGLMEEIKGAEYGDVMSYNEYADTVTLYQNDEASINANRSATVAEVVNEYDDPYYEVNVAVTWNWLGDNYMEQLTTLRGDY